jgi:hypothetical protein
MVALNIFEQPGYVVTPGKVVALFAALLVVHGLLVCLYLSFSYELFFQDSISPKNSLATRHLAWMTKGFVFINVGATIRKPFLMDRERQLI